MQTTAHHVQPLGPPQPCTEGEGLGLGVEQVRAPKGFKKWQHLLLQITSRLAQQSLERKTPFECALSTIWSDSLRCHQGKVSMGRTVPRRAMSMLGVAATAAAAVVIVDFLLLTNGRH